MWREQELVDGHDPGDAIAAIDQNAQVAQVPGLQETMTTFGTFEPASASAGALAPARGGSSTTAS
jgi:hypothetical protein